MRLFQTILLINNRPTAKAARGSVLPINPEKAYIIRTMVEIYVKTHQ